MILIMNLIYIAQFDTNGILTVLYIVVKHNIQTHYMYICMGSGHPAIHNAYWFKSLATWLDGHFTMLIGLSPWYGPIELATRQGGLFLLLIGLSPWYGPIELATRQGGLFILLIGLSPWYGPIELATRQGGLFIIIAYWFKSLVWPH